MVIRAMKMIMTRLTMRAMKMKMIGVMSDDIDKSDKGNFEADLPHHRQGGGSNCVHKVPAHEKNFHHCIL